MERFNIYIDWIRFLKKRGLYGKFIFHVARVVEIKNKLTHSTRYIGFWDYESLLKTCGFLTKWFPKISTEDELLNFMRDVDYVIFYGTYTTQKRYWISLFYAFEKELEDRKRAELLSATLSRRLTRSNSKIRSCSIEKEENGKWFDKVGRNRIVNRWQR